MPPKNLSTSQLLQQISAIIPNYCDKCGAKHNKSDIEIVNQDGNGVVCRLDCHSCNNSSIMHINSPSEGMLAARKSLIKTDISAEEMKKFSSLEIVDDNEILDAFIALENVKTQSDFDVLFNDKADSIA